MGDKPSIHQGHRDRMKQEFLKGGLEAFSDVRALELLLFYALPQGDVNPLAHRLLDTFDTLAGVMDANMEELKRVPGVGNHTATLIKLVTAISAKYMASRTDDRFILRRSHDLWELFSPYFFGARNEKTYLACFDGKLKLLGVRKISEGSPTGTDICVRQIMSAALSYDSSAVVLAHNHPSGVATPSDDDVSTTLYLRKYLQGVNIHVYDHVILTDEDMVSMRDSGYFIPVGF